MYFKGNAQFVQKVTFEPLDEFKKTYGSWKYYKSCYFLKFSAPKLLKHTITFLWQCFLIKLMRQTLTDDFWGLRKNMNCAFPLIVFTYTLNKQKMFSNLILTRYFVVQWRN